MVWVISLFYMNNIVANTRYSRLIPITFFIGFSSIVFIGSNHLIVIIKGVASRGVELFCLFQSFQKALSWAHKRNLDPILGV